MNIIISGALGRMGKELLESANTAGIGVVCGVDAAYQGQPASLPMVASCDELTGAADALIDFSRPEALPGLLAFCERHNVPCVLCATGYTDAELQRIAEASRRLPILRSANMSLGINVMEQLVSMAAKALGEGYDIEIVEKHHRMKVDSPSGTALMLYDSACGAVNTEITPVFGRHGRAQKRAKGDIGLHAIRGGTVVGEHEVGFYGEGEQVLLTHRAESRVLFAQGALRAARFLAGKPAGLYSMRDVVLEMLAKVSN